jgi:hypothetical protein
MGMVSFQSSSGWRSIRPGTHEVGGGTRRLALELGQLVQDQDTVMGEAHFPGARDGAAADEAGFRDGMVRERKGRVVTSAAWAGGYLAQTGDDR